MNTTPAEKQKGDWQVARPNGTCKQCQQPLDAAQEFIATLLEQGEHFERADYCQKCWDHTQPAVFSYWRTRLPEKEEKQKTFVDNDVLMNLFLRLESSSDVAKLNFRFVLALILMQKRILKYEQTENEGEQEYWIVRTSGQQQTHKVANPRLDEQQIEQVTAELGSILSTDIDLGSQGN